MSSVPEVRIGIIGYGIMGKAHSYGYRVAPMLFDLPVRPVVVAISGRDAAAVESAAHAYKIPRWTTDWRELVNDPDIDIIDVCTPPGTHSEFASAAAGAGKAVLCEKPMAAMYVDAAAAAEAAAAAGVLNAVGFNYRRLPAVTQMKRMIDDGAIGDVLMWRATWMTDEFLDPTIPFDWRFDVTMGGSSIADLGAHLFDMALWMVGDVEKVSAQSTTFTKERSTPQGPKIVTVDEASSVLLRFASGATGVVDLARVAAQSGCDLRVEVNGTKGSLAFDYSRLNELRYGTIEDDPTLYGMRTIRVEHASHPYSAHWWPLGQGIGYGASFVNQVADLLSSWPNGPWGPDFRHGAKVQAVCEAAERSAREGEWWCISDIS